jgi:aspartyl-tRNA(Asn)/glutamyl-tRNA(Gln) amidotransferase subunit A
LTDDIAYLSATDLLRHFRRGTLSPVEATRAALDRIARFDTELNAFILVDETAALAAARASEQRWRNGAPVGAVDGVPTTIKDMFLTRGWPTRRGSLTGSPDGPWNDDSPLVARLREQGAVLLGKTTQPEFGWKGVGDSPLTGITRNPWNVEKTPGGSSAGAAVAAAMGMGTLHAGGDGGGSIRIPASFTGIFGIKPSFGRVPNWPGRMPGSITHAGPMTRTVADAALMLTVMAGVDTRDWQALPYDGGDYTLGLEQGVRGLRIAYSATLGFATADPEVETLAAKAAVEFSEFGALVTEKNPSIGNPRPAFELYYAIRFTWLYDMLTEAQREMLDPGLVAMAQSGRRHDARAVLEADIFRNEMTPALDRFFDDHDLLLTPQMPLPAFDAGQDFPSGRNYTNWLDWSPFTYPFNFSGHPAASVPCGFVDGLPVGLQIVGPRYREDLVLRASRAWEAAHPFTMPRR